MMDAEEKRLPRWPLQLALFFILVVELFFVVMFIAEGDTGNIPMIVNSVGLLVLCVLAWRGIPWSRWLLIAFLGWRIVGIGVAMVSHFAPGDNRIGGSLLLVVLYVAVGLLVASPLGRSRTRSAN